MQPDLFDWQPPAATVIPFPTSKRVGLIRRTAARIVESRTQKEADAIWRRTVDDMARQMERAGIGEVRIDVELTALREGVQVEMARLARRPCRPGGGAA
ncbi:DUF6074 family protein [Antarcticirhabdus aurantiaca]|uniref:DUF6074 family protein n=1 Tax=Antarcticirhabdus aurantiaca TaxID=2606717 RepID=A0ACD4NWT0_9HYPH|nr:DUF6074 family protein [Jeongeuplla avenae]